MNLPDAAISPRSPSTAPSSKDAAPPSSAAKSPNPPPDTEHPSPTEAPSPTEVRPKKHGPSGKQIPLSWWEQASPIELDLGCARGKFLIEAAALLPDHAFIGVDRQSDRVLRACRKIQRLGLSNVLAIQGTILEFLRDEVPAAKVTRVHVLFPDPWPKRRHAPRRLVRAAFLDELERILLPGGCLRFLTDQAPYHAEASELISSRPGWSLSPPPSEAPKWPLTEFQARFLSRQHPVHTLHAIWSRSSRPE